MTANEFIKNHGPQSKFPRTGPVDYEYGARRFSAALKGVELKDKTGKNRLFKTYEAACEAILASAEKIA